MEDEEDVINLCCNCGAPIDKKGNCMYDEDGQIEEVFEVRAELSAALEREKLLEEALQWCADANHWGSVYNFPDRHLIVANAIARVKAMREGK